MDTWINELAFFLCGGTLMLSILGIIISIIMPGIDQHTRHFLIPFFSVLLIYVIFCVADVITYNDPNMVQAQKIVSYFESLSFSIILPMLSIYLLNSCGEEWRTSRLFHTAFFLWIMSMILLHASLFTDIFYIITDDNYFIRGPLYPLLCVPSILTVAVTLRGLILRRNKLTVKHFIAFTTCLIPLTVFSCLHLFVTVFSLVGLSLMLTVLMMFMINLFDLIEYYVHQQEEIARQRASIAVLQMRPHFIYNTMTSIYYLCDQDPQKAKQVTLDFTTYLRKNFTAIASEDTIPFSEELEHTRAYLAVEQAQFEDILSVDYDTPHTHFRIPPLTLQPIVENAVKYGCDPDSDPLHIVIRTRSTDSGSEITVEDNGPGYVDVDDNKPHIALANIRQRLELMCGGTMSISKRERGGTVVRIIIP
jgi:sensor histidine kinase YesM